MERRPSFLLQSAFFGLTLSYRANLFSQIHEIVFHGNGGYSYDIIYNMPIWLRRLTFNKIKEWYDKKSETQKKAENSWVEGEAKQEASKRKKITPPSYITKASKK